MNLIEPHRDFLKKPEKGTLLYKIIPLQYFIDMLDRNYLYFNRVDQYKDDARDSDQTDKDKRLTTTVVFEKNPKYSTNLMYGNARSRSYACCFSTMQSDYIWEKYGGPDLSPCCLVLDCEMLINFLNNNYLQCNLRYNCRLLQPLFFLNYGLITYGDLVEDALVNPYLPNPVEYLYFKDHNYFEEKEFRVTLSTFGLGRFIFSDGTEFTFPDSLCMEFNFRDAFDAKIIRKIIIKNTSEKNFVKKLTQKLDACGIDVNLIIERK